MLSYHDVYESPWVDDPQTTKVGADIKPGDPVTLPAELGSARGTVDRVAPSVGRCVVRVGEMRVTVPIDCVTRAVPRWLPGDVVVVRFGPDGQPYTYVRGRLSWPTDGERAPKTDEWMSARFAEGRATPVLQAGGEPFDRGRFA